jgi:hypothetical protein
MPGSRLLQLVMILQNDMWINYDLFIDAVTWLVHEGKVTASDDGYALKSRGIELLEQIGL